MMRTLGLACFAAPRFGGALAAIALLVVLPGCGRSLDPAQAQRFREAQQWFDRAQDPDDYLRAASLYQEILDSGFRSGAVLYNQGNAYMRAGQRGRALAAYAQAVRYRPRDPQLRANLSLARGDAPQPRPLVETVFFWQNWLSYREKFVLAGGLAAITTLLAAAMLLRPDWRLGWPAAAVGVALAVACTSAGYDWYRYDWLRHGVVTEPEAVARKGDSARYEPAFTAPLAEGTTFQVAASRGDWLLIRLPGGEGWLKATAAVVY